MGGVKASRGVCTGLTSVLTCLSSRGGVEVWYAGELRMRYRGMEAIFRHEVWRRATFETAHAHAYV